MPKRARERIEVYLDGTSRRPFVNHDVNAVVLHRRIEVLLHDGAETVYLIDEQHIVRFEAREQPCEVTGFVQHRTAGYLESHAKLIGDDITQGRLTQARRAEEQDVVQTLVTKLRCFYEYLQIGCHLTLPCEVGKAQRTQRTILLLLVHLLSYIKICHISWIKD